MEKITTKTELVRAFKENEHFRRDFENFIKIILREYSYPVKRIPTGDNISIYYNIKESCATTCDTEKDVYSNDSNFIYITSMKRAYWKSIYKDYEQIRKHIEAIGGDMVEDIVNFQKWMDKKHLIDDYIYYSVGEIISRMEKEIEEEKEEEN